MLNLVLSVSRFERVGRAVAENRGFGSGAELSGEGGLTGPRWRSDRPPRSFGVPGTTDFVSRGTISVVGNTEFFPV